ncbi:membrane hypothetical protein [Gammaproteobacteria bacterium]
MIKTITGLVLVILINLWLALSFRGTYAHGFAVFLCFVCGMFFVILIVISLDIKYFSNKSNRIAIKEQGKWVLTASIVIISTPLSLIPGSWIRNWDIAQAKLYCESLIPKLERIKGDW